MLTVAFFMKRLSVTLQSKVQLIDNKLFLASFFVGLSYASFCV